MLRMTSTRATQFVHAPRAAVYRALLDPGAVEKWKVPTGMSCHVHAFEAREGGEFRVSLTYEARAARGKTSARTDTYHGHFARLVVNETVVEVLEFETHDPALQGIMTLTWTLRDVGDGTEVVAVHDGLPPGVPVADNELGYKLALAKLAALVEGREQG